VWPSPSPCLHPHPPSPPTHLALDVELRQARHRLVRVQLGQLRRRLVARLADVADPAVDHGQGGGAGGHGEGGLDRTAVGVAAHDDGLDLEGLDRVLQAGHVVHVVVQRLVAHIALHKDLTRRQTQHLVGLGIAGDGEAGGGLGGAAERCFAADNL